MLIEGTLLMLPPRGRMGFGLILGGGSWRESSDDNLLLDWVQGR